jgi:threonylcarbamoyladenosine tRNA methylthiotransferase MtaB
MYLCPVNISSKKVAFHTLGCKLNFAETSAIARGFVKEGYEEVGFSEQADVYVLNTCSVTENADKECRQLVRQVKRLSPDATVALIGCYAQLKAEELGKVEGVDLVLGAKEKFNLVQYVNNLIKKDQAEVHSCEIEAVQDFISSYSAGHRTRSFLKVQDGCDYTCSYCTIPLARGASRSDSIADVVKQAHEIGKQGIREIVLTGVNIGDFGYNESAEGMRRKENFLQLVKALDEVETISRFRISSIEPNLLKDEIIEFVAQSQRFAPHFHVPLQSGSNKILNLMRRRYQRDLYAERVSAIKKRMPHACIGVDVIVGFPGETKEDFLETYDFIHSLDISYLHVFTYSERPNTDAISLPGAVPIHERKERNKMLRNLSSKKLRSFYEQHAGQSRTVLFESEQRDGVISGFTDNYIKVQMPFDETLVNALYKMELTQINKDEVFEGRPVKKPVQEAIS